MAWDFFFPIIECPRSIIGIPLAEPVGIAEIKQLNDIVRRNLEIGSAPDWLFNPSSFTALPVKLIKRRILTSVVDSGPILDGRNTIAADILKLQSVPKLFRAEPTALVQ